MNIPDDGYSKDAPCPLIKTLISNLVCTRRFWNNRHQVRSKSNDWKAKKIQVLGTIKPKGINRIAEIG
jgi:hypothetical protein